MKFELFIVCSIAIGLSAAGQQTDLADTTDFKTDIKTLIALNSTTQGLVDLRGNEAIRLQTLATTEQLMEVTAPYLLSDRTNAKNICITLLSTALFKKSNTLFQKQQIVTIICSNYLEADEDIQVVDNILLQQSAACFTPAAKKYVANLINPAPKSLPPVCAQLLAMAQIRESIPALWKMVNKDILKMQSSDIDILASLARMGEKEAGQLLCTYYTHQKNRTDYRYIFNSRKMAFSLDASVLKCLVDDFRSLDLSVAFRSGDSGFYPAGFLGDNITAMLKNYPYPKKYEVNTDQLLRWLNSRDVQPEMQEK